MYQRLEDCIHEGPVIVTGFLRVCGGGIEALFGGQLLELCEGGLFLSGEMPDVTLQSSLSTGGFGWWRALLIGRNTVVFDHDFWIA